MLSDIQDYLSLKSSDNSRQTQSTTTGTEQTMGVVTGVAAFFVAAHKTFEKSRTNDHRPIYPEHS